MLKAIASTISLLLKLTVWFTGIATAVAFICVMLKHEEGSPLPILPVEEHVGLAALFLFALLVVARGIDAVITEQGS